MLATLGAELAELALSMDTTLINSALFGAVHHVTLRNYDRAAALYELGARLKRPCFVTPDGHLRQNGGGGNFGGGGGGSGGGGDEPSVAAVWETAASMDPLSATNRQIIHVEHPGSRLGGSGDIAMDAEASFRVVSFAAYNSAQVRHSAEQLRHLVANRTIDAGPTTFVGAAAEYEALARHMDVLRGGVRYRDEADGLVAHHESVLPIPGSVHIAPGGREHKQRVVEF